MSNKANINTSKTSDCELTPKTSDTLCYPKTSSVKSLNTIKTLIDKTVCPEETDDCSLSKDSLVYPAASLIKTTKVKAIITLYSNVQYIQCANLPDWSIHPDYTTALTTTSDYREENITVDVITGLTYNDATDSYDNIIESKTQAIHSVYVNYGQFTTTYTEGETTQAEIDALQEEIDNSAILYGYSLLQCGFTNLDNILVCPTISNYTTNNYYNNIINPDNSSSISVLTYRENLSNVLTDDIYLGNSVSGDVEVDSDDDIITTVEDSVYDLQTTLNATTLTYLRSNLNCNYKNEELNLTCPKVNSTIIKSDDESNNITIEESVFTLNLNGTTLYDLDKTFNTDSAVTSFESFLSSFELYIQSSIVCYYTNTEESIYCPSGFTPEDSVISTTYEGTYSDVLTYNIDDYGININVNTLALSFNNTSESTLISTIQDNMDSAKETAMESACYVGNEEYTATCNNDICCYVNDAGECTNSGDGFSTIDAEDVYNNVSLEEFNMLFEVAPEPNSLKFTGTSTFTLSAAYHIWDGTVEYSTDGSTWTTWGSNETIGGTTTLYLRGSNNTRFATGTAATARTNFVFNTTGTISASGRIDSLLDWETVGLGGTPAMSSFCYLYMFYNCASLVTAPDLPATTLTGFCYGNMFYGCTSLITAPELPATTLASYCYFSMFCGCTSLITAPDLPATTLASYCCWYMFYNCASLMVSTSYNASSYNYTWRIPSNEDDTISSEVTSWSSYMLTGTGGDFKGDPSINTTYYLDIGTVIEPELYLIYSTSSVTDERIDFDTTAEMKTWIASNNTSLVGSLTAVRKNVDDGFTTSGSFFSGCLYITSLDLSNFDTVGFNSGYGMFYNCRNMLNLDLSGVDTSAMTTMHSMLSMCTSLLSLDVSGFNTINVTNMAYMLYNCQSLTGLDLSSFDTSSVTNMGYTFGGCSSLISLDLSNWDTSSLPNLSSTNYLIAMEYMFRYCSSLQEVYWATNKTIVQTLQEDSYLGTYGTTIYVPDSLVEEYKQTFYFSAWSSQIVGVSSSSYLVSSSQTPATVNVTPITNDILVGATTTTSGFDSDAYYTIREENPKLPSLYITGLTSYTITQHTFIEYYTTNGYSAATLQAQVNNSAITNAEAYLVCLYGNLPLKALTCGDIYGDERCGTSGWWEYSEDPAAVAGNLFINSDFCSSQIAAYSYQLAASLCLCTDEIGSGNTVSGESSTSCSDCADYYCLFG